MRGMTEGARKPADQAQRLAALDPRRSFIVQAPAGSGKTGLLTLRFLRLLAAADDPEEIVAVTFTRKAAAEMRGRILEALAAALEPEPSEPWERQTWKLATAALQRARERGWNLLENPQRLRIRTIDSLCQYLATQLPLRSGFGEPPGVEQDARALYRLAARSALAELETGSAMGVALAVLLPHLDNRLDALSDLLADMLERRDQWLPILVRPNPRALVEKALQDVIEEHLRGLRAQFPRELGEELMRLARYAAGNLGANHPLDACRTLRQLPPTTPAGLPAWQALTDMLLTGKGAWRRAVNVANGFPTGRGEAAAAKQAMLDLLSVLQTDIGLADALSGVNGLPTPSYSDDEWGLIEAMFTALLGAAAHLRLVFREQGRVDFSETAMAAQAALGDDLEPTALALRLDYQLRHLLVDEFQDTSQSQHELLRGLTAGWQPGDGRTLFLVGDPMQSIYRFRKAEVGLFLDAWEGRLGDLPLQPLQLQVNFRSESGLIDWVNRQFPQVFPATPDKLKGAVPYVPSAAFRPGGSDAAVTLHPFIGRDDEAEAALMLELIRAARAEQPDGTVAVLVRSKAHLEQLIPVLRDARMSYQAVEIGALARRPAVLDLLALTLALLHPADRVSWLALLHGPLCGMTLADLLALCGDEQPADDVPLPTLLGDEVRVATMSADGQARARACRGLLRTAMEERGRQSLRDWVEGTWLALGGPASLADDAAAEDVEVYLRLLQELGEADELVTPERLREGVEALYALPDPQGDPRLQLMTVHKAKGLEFDTVILPGMGKATQGDKRKLLYWQETVSDRGDVELLFGPVKPASASKDSRISAYIKQLQAEMGRLESGRLLYVAVTRAKSRVHLIGHASCKKDGSLAVDRASLLSQLWPAVEGSWRAAADRESVVTDALETEGARTTTEPSRWRLPAAWVCPEPPPAIGAKRAQVPEAAEGVVFEWAGDVARSVGTVVHAWLQRLAQTPAEGLADVASLEPAARRMLQREGVPAAELELAVKRVRTAVEGALRDERGRWILSPRHEGARNELPVTALIDGRLRHMVIDRTFIDGDGARWIIDYKTGTHEGGNVSGFLDQEQERYRGQLEAYAAAFRLLEQRPVRTALYYPLVRN
jgi:ATP-dependent exoDNAse (exonuclease V) beta subunit